MGRSRLLRRAALLSASIASLAAIAACGLGFEPGEYAEVRPLVGGSDTGPGADDATAASDSDLPVVPDGGARVMIVGGRRDPFGPNDFSPYVAETLIASISSTGEPTGFTYDRSPPSATNYTGSLLRGGNLYVHTGGYTAYRAPLADRLTSDWLILPQRGSGPPISGLRPSLVTEKGLLGAGGQGNDGGQTVWLTDVYFAPFDFADAGVGPWVASPSVLVKPRQDVTLYATEKFVYAIGGRDNFNTFGPERDDVEVASLAADGQPGAFAATEKMINPATSQPLGLIAPTVIAGAGHLFIIGGQLDLQSKTSDIVIAAPIDQNNGTLGKWKGLPRLPGPLSGAAVVIHSSKIIIFGGSGATSLTDAILALDIKSDGTFGTEWKRVGSLPAPRAGIVAEIY